MSIFEYQNKYNLILNLNFLDSLLFSNVASLISCKSNWYSNNTFT